MVYLTYEEYNERRDECPFLPELDDERFKELEASARLAIDAMTRHFLRFNSLDKQIKAIQDIVKEATALTVANIEKTGVADSTDGVAMQSVSIGGTSLSTGSGNSGSQSLSVVPAEARQLLSLTGWTTRAVRYV